MNYILTKTTRRGTRELETDSEKVRDRHVKKGWVQVEPVVKKKCRKGKGEK